MLSFFLNSKAQSVSLFMACRSFDFNFLAGVVGIRSMMSAYAYIGSAASVVYFYWLYYFFGPDLRKYIRFIYIYVQIFSLG